MVNRMATETMALDGEDSQRHWDEECGRLLDRLRDHHHAGGPPIHIDIVADEEEPSISWPQVYIYVPYVSGRSHRRLVVHRLRIRKAR